MKSSLFPRLVEMFMVFCQIAAHMVMANDHPVVSFCLDASSIHAEWFLWLCLWRCLLDGDRKSCRSTVFRMLFAIYGCSCAVCVNLLCSSAVVLLSLDVSVQIFRMSSVARPYVFKRIILFF